jgi:hypothetical protein
MQCEPGCGGSSSTSNLLPALPKKCLNHCPQESSSTAINGSPNDWNIGHQLQRQRRLFDPENLPDPSSSKYTILQAQLLERRAAERARQIVEVGDPREPRNAEEIPGALRQEDLAVGAGVDDSRCSAAEVPTRRK